MTEQKYRLYAGRTTTIPDGVEYSLIATHNRYMLVFTDKTLGKPFVEIPDGTELLEEERRFVFDCKMKVNTKFVKEHKDEITEGFDLLLTELEKSLVEEQKKLKGEKK